MDVSTEERLADKMSETTEAKPRVKYKSFQYETRLVWTGDRSGEISSPDKRDFTVSSPPEFKGEKGLWTPEDLFVASVNICTMTTFLALAERRGLNLRSYAAEAGGVLEYLDGGYRFTKITIRPVIGLVSKSDEAEAGRLMHDAHAKCLIANSIRTDVEILPTFTAN